MPSKPPAKPPNVFGDIRNCHRVMGPHAASIDQGQAWLNTVRRHTINQWFPNPLTEALYPDTDPLKLRLRLAPYQLRWQWGVVATGEGVVCCQAAGEAFFGQIAVDIVTNWYQDDEPFLLTPRQCETPAADEEYRPIVESPATIGDWESEDIDIWVEDDTYGTVSVRVWELFFIPLPRLSSDADLA